MAHTRRFNTRLKRRYKNACHRAAASISKAQRDHSGVSAACCNGDGVNYPARAENSRENRAKYATGAAVGPGLFVDLARFSNIARNFPNRRYYNEGIDRSPPRTEFKLVSPRLFPRCL